MDHMPVNTFNWNELATTDSAKCKEFYCQLFGWTPETVPAGAHEYTTFKQDGHMVGGMIQMTKEWGDIRPHWMGYIGVEDVDRTAQRLKELGGKVCVPPTDISVGRFAVVEDPTGAVFSIITWKKS